MGRIAKGRLVRSVAILFLLYTGLDIACPQLCSEGLVSLAAASETARSDINEPESAIGENVGAVSVREDSRQNGPTEQKSQEEDCFCCCAHIVPGVAYVAPTHSDLKFPRSVPGSTAVLTPPLFGTFRPPRFA